MIFSRSFAMPTADTFSIPVIATFIGRYASDRDSTVDPFARNRGRIWAAHTNDLDQTCDTNLHLDAEEACATWRAAGIRASLALFDPPYSPRQIADVYGRVGLKVGQEETQSGRLYRRVRDALDHLIVAGGVVLSFGWQSAGMGLKRGYEPLEIMLVMHGGAHNDTICIAERKISGAHA